MATYKNKHGQEPSSPLAEDYPVIQSPGPNDKSRLVANRFIQRNGHEPIDPTRCQAPWIEPGRGPYDYVRCPHKAAYVMVENNPRPNGLIAAMAICEGHRERLIRSQPPDYAEITPITGTR